MSRHQRSHSEIYLHFVWTTKYRLPTLDEKIEAAVKKVLFSKAKELKVEVIEVNGSRDHIHLLVKSHPTIAPAKIAKIMKGASSHFVNHVTLKDDKIRALYWQDGYGVVSVSPQAVPIVRSYIRKQKEHHSANTLDPNFEKIGTR